MGELSIMYTVIKKTPELVIKEKYKLTGENNFCTPVEQVFIDDTQAIAEIVILEHDQKQMQAAEMNELIQNGALCFDNPAEFEMWKDKNGKVQLDENGKPITPTKSIIDTLINLIGL